jgi:hypothetical protein
MAQMASAESAGMIATSRATEIAVIFAAIRVGTRYGNWISRTRFLFRGRAFGMATNGNSVTATYTAPNVGTNTPSSGESPFAGAGWSRAAELARRKRTA